MIVTSYFTCNGRYPDLAERLAASCARFGVEHDIVEVADPGDWHRGCGMKPDRILGSLLRYREPILWMDVDCEFVASPESLATAEADFAIYNWRADAANRPGAPADPTQLMCSGGVSLWGYTAPAMDLLIRWQGVIAKSPPGEDDPMLDYAFNTFRPPVTTAWLSKRQNWMTGLWGEPPADCIVRHDYTNGQHRQE